MLLLVDVVALLLVAETTVDDCTVADAVDGDALASVRADVPAPQPATIKTETASAAIRRSWRIIRLDEPRRIPVPGRCAPINVAGPSRLVRLLRVKLGVAWESSSNWRP